MELRKQIALALQDWLNWVADGAVEDNPFGFETDAGLCDCLLAHPAFTSDSYDKEMLNELSDMFEEDGLNAVYPFNTIANGRSYITEAYESIMHENPDRLAWARKTVNQYGS